MTTIKLSGTLGPNAAHELRGQLKLLSERDRPRIHVDIRQVVELHPAGIAALVNGYVAARHHSGQLTISAPVSGPVRDMLRMSGIASVLER